MKPAIYVCMMNGRGDAEVLEAILDRLDVELITLGATTSLLNQWGVPNRRLLEFDAPGFSDLAAATARARAERVKPLLPEAFRRAYPQYDEDLRRELAAVVVKAFDEGALSRELDYFSMLIRAAAAQADLRLLLVSEDFSPTNRVITLTAQRLGIPALQVVHGTPGRNYDPHARVVCSTYVAAYSEYVKRHYVAFGAKPENVRITGNPAWDRYAGPPSQIKRCQIRKQAGLDPERPIVTYGMTWTKDDLCTRLAEAVVEGFIGLAKRHPDWQFQLRPHPVSPHPVESLQPLVKRAAAGGLGRLVIDRTHPQASLLISDVVVSAPSGWAVEAVLQGIPTILEELEELRAHRFDEDPEALFGGPETVLHARTKTDISSMVEAALMDEPTRRRLREMRARGISKLNYRNDGRATERIVDWIEEILDLRPGPGNSAFAEARRARRARAETQNRSGEQAYREGRMEAALASFAAAYGEWPYDAVYANNMATVFAAMGDYEQAWDRVVEALSVDPNLESARENLRVVGKRLRKHDEAEILLSMFGEDGCKGPEA